MTILDATAHYLTLGYRQRDEARYFLDEDATGVTWQPDVYPEALAIARAHSRSTIIDLGCGRAGKLMALCQTDSRLKTVGVDHGDNIEWCRHHFPGLAWLKADLESTTELPLPPERVADSVVVCSDVLEHLVNPRAAVDLIVWLLDRGAARAVLSTPARDRRVGAGHMGPPLNPAHVREWTCQEFRAFLSSFPVHIERFDLTRSDDAGGGMTTQLAVLARLVEKS